MAGKMNKLLTSGKEYNYISMDLGTANTLVYVGSQGIIFNEPSVIAYEVREKKVLGIGTIAFDLLGKENPSIKVVKPLVDGVIADLTATEDLLKSIFDRIKSLDTWRNAIVLLASPSSISEVERQALYRIAKELGAKYVFIEEEVKMAALGSGVNIDSIRGQLVVDIGGGTTDIALISAGDVVVSKSLRVAGNWFNDTIVELCKKKHGMEIGIRTAEKIKKIIGNVESPKSGEVVEDSMLVRGRDIQTGQPAEFKVTSKEVKAQMIEGARLMSEVIQEILREAPAELCADLMETGITLTGGGALIKGLDTYFEKQFKIPTQVGKDPLLGVVNGTIKYQDIIVQRIESGSFIGMIESGR